MMGRGRRKGEREVWKKSGCSGYSPQGDGVLWNGSSRGGQDGWG